MSSSSGMLGGVIDVQKTVDELMKGESRQLNIFQKDDRNESIRLNSYNTLLSMFQTYETKLKDLNTAFTTTYTATSSNTAAVEASVTGTNIPPVSHSIWVTQLAQAESDESVNTYSSSTSNLNMTNTMTITVGSNHFSINVIPGDTLQNVVDKINNAAGNTYAVASILSTTSGGVPTYQLVISSTQTGLANRVTIGETGSGANKFDMSTRYQQAQDAIFNFDGSNVQRSTNTVNDVITGLTIKLHSTLVAGTPATLSVIGTDPTPSSVTAAIQPLLDSYNDIIKFLDTQQVNPVTSLGDFSSIKALIQYNMNNVATTLSSIGIVPMAPQVMTTTIPVVDKTGQDVRKQVTFSSMGQWQINTNTNINGTQLPSLVSALSTNFSTVKSTLVDSTSGVFTLLGNLLQTGYSSQNVNSLVNDDVKNVTDAQTDTRQKIADEELRLKDVEMNYIMQYSSLNVLLQRLDEQSKFLTKQLNGLPSWA